MPQQLAAKNGTGVVPFLAMLQAWDLFRVHKRQEFQLAKGNEKEEEEKLLNSMEELGYSKSDITKVKKPKEEYEFSGRTVKSSC